VASLTLLAASMSSIYRTRRGGAPASSHGIVMNSFFSVRILAKRYILQPKYLKELAETRWHYF